MQQNNLMPRKSHLWDYPSTILQRLHSDYAGSFLGKRLFFIVVDAYNKWPEVVSMNSTTTRSNEEVCNSWHSRAVCL